MCLFSWRHFLYFGIVLSNSPVQSGFCGLFVVSFLGRKALLGLPDFKAELRLSKCLDFCPYNFVESLLRHDFQLGETFSSTF